MMNKRNRKDAAKYIVIDGDSAYVELTQGRVAVIDAADVNLIGVRLWHLNSDGYAKANAIVNGKPTLVALHRVILGNPKGVIDHIDQDPLNNRRSNLRVCTDQENQRNQRPRTAYKGKPVSCPHKGVRRTRWGNYEARLCIDGRRKSLGTFATAEKAAQVYSAAAREHFGEFAMAGKALNEKYPLEVKDGE